MRINNPAALCLLFIVLLSYSCQKLPSKELSQWKDDSWANFANDTLTLYLHNPLRCPMQFKISSTNAVLNQKLKPIQHLILEYAADTLIKIPATKATYQSVTVKHGLGNPNEEINTNKLSLPFQQGKSYSIIQSYNGSYSHNDTYSRYAVDFSLKKGDTVCAATDGYVVGIIKDYELGGADKKWKPYANFITLYHPADNIFTQYAHLQHNGVLVETGDYITAGQPIGLAGSTGWTSMQHLHFNVLKAVDTTEWLESIPADYYEGYKGQDFKQGNVVHKPAF